MSKPVIVVMSRRVHWTGQLAESASGGYEFVTCSSLQDLEKVTKDKKADGIIADMLDVSGGGHQQEQLLERLRSRMTDLPMAMLTGEACPEPLERRAQFSHIEHLRGNVSVANVLDWLEKSVPTGITIAAKPTRVNHAHPNSTNSASSVLAGITRQFETYTPQLKHMLDELAIAAEKDVTVLLIGETGSGKTYLSKLIHEVSPRHDQPFLTVACGALPGDLIESELFGHMKGLFTSAHADKDGKFITAGRGTILLDEIDVLGPEQQVKLLRVIETGEFEPVGSNTTLTSQARLVVASNLALEPLVEKGKFRPDLYYRLSMLKFELPPLRSRKPDIKPLARRFIQDKAMKHDVAVVRIEQEFFDALQGYPWPGNVRELEYAIQRAVIYCREGVLKASHLPSHIIDGVAGPTNDPSVKLESKSTLASTFELGEQLAGTERDLIEQALMRNNFNRTRTAKELGVSRVTLYNKMKRYELS